MKKRLSLLLLLLALPLLGDSVYQKGVTAYEAKKYDTALKYFYISAREYNVNAYTRLGIIHDRGLGTGINKQTALYWYAKAAKLNHPDAQYGLAQLYEKGEGTKPNMKMATFWYQKAAKNGNKKAQLRLSGKTPHHKKQEPKQKTKSFSTL